ncbi:hypothetical protein GCM10009630_31700 [Kribbella jejuensis]
MLSLSPSDGPVRQLAVTSGNDLTASHPNGGYSPGRHIHGPSLRRRLKAVFSTRAARLGTLHELTKVGPLPIIGCALGYHPSTIEHHAIGSITNTSQPGIRWPDRPDALCARRTLDRADVRSLR